MRKLLAIIAVAAVVFAATGNDKRYQVFGVAFYNLENFFDTINNNGKYDYEYTENGSKKWNGEKYRNKVHNMARGGRSRCRPSADTPTRVYIPVRSTTRVATSCRLRRCLTTATACR